MDYEEFDDCIGAVFSYDKTRVSVPYICKLGNNSNVNITKYMEGNKQYYEIILNLGNEKRNLGKYICEDQDKIINALYKNNKLLIYYTKFFRNNINDFKIVDVIMLYNILDDMIYSLSDLETLQYFDSNLDCTFLESPNKHKIYSKLSKRIGIK